LEPGLELPFATPGTGVIRITNGCTASSSVSDPRSRLGLADFALSSTLPLNIAAGSSGELAVSFAPRAANGPLEDILFVTIANGNDSVRYPFTLYRP
jgi:hypothetical protein